MSLKDKRKAGVTDAPEVKPKIERGEFDTVSQEEMDEIMKNYDPESNVRVWQGVPQYVVKCILAAFSMQPCPPSSAPLRYHFEAFLVLYMPYSSVEYMSPRARHADDSFFLAHLFR